MAWRLFRLVLLDRRVQESKRLAGQDKEILVTQTLRPFQLFELVQSMQRLELHFACETRTTANGEVIPHVSPIPNTRLIGHLWNLLSIPLLNHVVFLTKLARRTYTAVSAMGVVSFPKSRSAASIISSCVHHLS